MQSMAAEFSSFQQLIEKWFLPGSPPKTRKKYLQKAFKAVKPVLKFLTEIDELPHGLDPIELASKVISLRQGPEHVEMAIPLVMSVLNKKAERGQPGGPTLRARCRKDVAVWRRACQDLYGLLCHALHLLESSGRASAQLSAERCVAEYNAKRPVARRFASAAGCHRQLPGVRARAWWPEADVPYAALRRLREQAEEVREEVLRVTAAPDFAAWDPLKNDPTLTVNADWDPRASWDSIVIFFKNEWNATACRLLPATCGVLLAQRAELERLCDTTRYKELVPEEVRKQGYDEVPTLGIKLYRVWPRAGLKAHSGSPARLVTSLALQAPPNSSLTVAGETREWVPGVVHHFDDAFIHSVDNPDESEFRIVLAVMTWHPDLNPLASGEAARAVSTEL